MLIGNRRVLRTWLLVFAAGLLALTVAVLTGAASPALATDTCSAGTYSNGSTCVPADAGHYAPGDNNEYPCPAGSFQPNSGAVSCFEAQPGNFVASSGQAVQTPCPAGSFQPNSGAVSCLEAQPGNFVASPGQAAQTACPVGAYQPDSGSINCTAAGPGYYVRSTGQPSETACAPGTYQPDSGAAGCIAASVNYYVPGSAATAQLPCAAGTYQPNTGQSSCITVPCPQGTKANFRWHYTANGSAGSWSGTATHACPGSFSMGPQSMEGSLQVTPGTTLQAGYDFTLPGNKNSLTMTVSDAQVTFAVACVSGATPLASTITVPLSAQTYQITNDQWYPSGDQSSPLVYQGSVTVPDLCGGGKMSLAKGGTFTATLG